MDERKNRSTMTASTTRSTRRFSAGQAAAARGIPVYFGGSSDAAIAVAGKHADIYALWGETHAQVKETDPPRPRRRRARMAASPRFSLSLRPILAETEEAAWAKADAILEKAKALSRPARSELLINATLKQIGGQTGQ